MNKRKDISPQTSPQKKAKNVRVTRPDFPLLDPKKDHLVFQLLEFDHYIGGVYPGMPRAQSAPVPIMRMFGVTKDNNSVCCHVHGFTPYLYLLLPDTFTTDDLDPFKLSLNNAILVDVKMDSLKEAVLMVEIVRGQSLMEYQGEQNQDFAKITVALPKLIAPAKRLLETATVYKKLENCHVQVFEFNVDIEMRFMIDLKVLGCAWIELPAGKWFRRGACSQFAVASRCQLEVDVSSDDFVAHAPEGEWGSVAQFRVLSFDIECAGRKGIFPVAQKDPVIQIANVLQLHGVDEPMLCNIFTLNTCAPIDHAEVFSFKTEKEMLESWFKFVRESDPDILTGWYINNFDLPYLLDRGKHLKLDSFNDLGRILNIRSEVREVTNQTKFGRRVTKYMNCEGRVAYDMYVVTKRDFKLKSYTLNNVSRKFLGEQKEDVHFSIITDLQNGDEQTRRKLAVYCIKDALLPLRLLKHMKSLTNDIEMSRIAGVPLTSLLNNEEQVNVVAHLLRHGREHNYLIPMHYGPLSSKKYEATTYIEPMAGYYKESIVTLDFNSLYPSIMIAHNLCFTTYLSTQDKFGLTCDEVTTTPLDHMFVKASVRRGLLPHILEHLLAARKKTMVELKDATDPSLRAVLDARQLAYKLSANSVYDFTMTQVGNLLCLEISRSVTAYGRTMIERTRQEIEQRYCIANGYKTDAKVIYGDTNSVKVNFKVETVEDSMALGMEAAEYISTKFIKPCKLEFVNLHCPYLLIDKKCYAGLYFTRTDKYDKMDCKGIEPVQRDNCTLVVDMINTCIQKLMINKDPDGAVAHSKQVISNLLQNKVDISQLVITKELSKADQCTRQPHAVLARKISNRDPRKAPKLGDLIPYVVTAVGKNAYAEVEDPIYAVENKITIDSNYYLQNQLLKPLLRIFKPILGDEAASILLRGEHT